MTAPVLPLTLTEARELYDHLRSEWIRQDDPQHYETMQQLLKRLTQFIEEHP